MIVIMRRASDSRKSIVNEDVRSMWHNRWDKEHGSGICEVDVDQTLTSGPSHLTLRERSDSTKLSRRAIPRGALNELTSLGEYPGEIEDTMVSRTCVKHSYAKVRLRCLTRRIQRVLVNQTTQVFLGSNVSVILTHSFCL